MDIRDITFSYYLKNKQKKYLPADWMNGSILEIGAGLDNYSSLVHNKNYTACDMDITLGASIKRFVQADISFLPFKPGTFDWFIANSILEHVPDPQSVLNQLALIVREGGLVSIPVLDSFPFLYDPVNWILKKLNRNPVNFGIHGFGHISMHYRTKWEEMFDQAGFVTIKAIPSRINLFAALEFFIISLFLSHKEYTLLMNSLHGFSSKNKQFAPRLLGFIKMVVRPFYYLLYKAGFDLKGSIGYMYYLKKSSNLKNNY